ncbi:MAG: Succinate dehydrogenase flavoprotein subunit, partial [uncultured Pseudonocardia sp.]
RGRPGHQQRGEGRPRVAPWRRLPRHRVAPLDRVHPQAAAVDVPPVQGARRGRHHGRADGGGPDLPLRHGRRRGRPRHGGGARAGVLGSGPCGTGRGRCGAAGARDRVPAPATL